VLALTRFFGDASEAPLRSLWDTLNRLNLSGLPNYSPSLRLVARNSVRAHTPPHPLSYHV
jgi:hypothetical protein